MGAAAGEGLDALLSSWAHSPTAGRLRQHEDGLEPPTDFLGDSEFALDLLLPPSPAPPVEDSSGSGTATLSGPPPLAHPFQQQHSVQQHIMLQHQPQHHQQQPVAMPALPPGYVLAANGAGALPALDLSAASTGQQASVAVQEQYAMQAPGYQQPPLQQMPSGGMGGQPLVLPTLSALRVDSSTHRTTTGVPSASDAPTATNTNTVGPDGKRRRGPRPRIFKKHACQADGCAVDLAPLSFYLQRNHICPDHLKADNYPVKGVPSRFCQRCGQGHPLTEFEGSKRSCRKALERHNQRRRDKQAASTATGPSIVDAANVAAAVAVAEAVTLQQQHQPQQQQAAVVGGEAEQLSFGLLDASFEVALQPQMSSHVLQALPAAHQGLQPSLASQPQHQQAQQQQQAQQAQQQQAQQQQEQQQRQQQHQQHQQHIAMQQAQLSSPPPLQLQQQQQQPVAEQQSQWVLLPRHLVEQQAPQLLGAAIAAPRSAISQPRAPQPEQPQQVQPAQMHQTQPLPAAQTQPQASPQQALQQQQQQQQQQGWPTKVDVNGGALVDAPSFNLFFGEFGGSGI